MTLRSSLLRELEKQNLSVNRRVQVSCELAKELEYKGEYEMRGKCFARSGPVLASDQKRKD